MKRSTVVFLILMRLAIGWHFLFEGLDKVRSLWLGPSEINRPFSSAGYFREAPGPLGGWMRWAIGDPDQELIARIVPLPEPDAPREKPYQYIPPALGKELDDYAALLTKHYQLDDQQQQELATRLQQARSDLVDWLNWKDKNFSTDEKEKAKRGIKKVKKSFQTGVVEVEQTFPERRADYLVQLKEVRDIQSTKLWLFGKDVEKQRLLKAKADLIQTRTALAQDLEDKVAEEKKVLADVATPKQKALGEPDAPAGNRFLKALDYGTAWGLTVMGACLIVGLLTRTNCILLAAFLVMTYLAVPAFPWLPVPPNTEGNYYYVNKNLIELLALLVLATTASGRWFGLDALLHRLFAAVRGEPNERVAVQPPHSENIALMSH